MLESELVGFLYPLYGKHRPHEDPKKITDINLFNRPEGSRLPKEGGPPVDSDALVDELRRLKDLAKKTRGRGIIFKRPPPR